jgi:hypothetical protein
LDEKKIVYKKITVTQGTSRVPLTKTSKPNAENANARENNASLFFMDFSSLANCILRMSKPVSRGNSKNKVSLACISIVNTIKKARTQYHGAFLNTKIRHAQYEMARYKHTKEKKTSVDGWYDPV